jgi:hypothetical protein
MYIIQCIAYKLMCVEINIRVTARRLDEEINTNKIFGALY